MPQEGMGRLDARLVEAVVVAGLMVGAAVLYALFALRVGSFQPDEWYYMELARVIAHHFPAGLWQQGIYWRGIERIDQLVLAAPFAFLRGASVYEVAHVIQVLLYTSTAIPVWLLARAAGLERWPRVLAVLMVLAAPWAIVSTSFLGESAAYPAYAWVLYTTWRAISGPSYRREAVAIAALVVAALSRTALIALAPILPLAVLWQVWMWELREHRWLPRIRMLPRQLWAGHRLVTSIAVLAVAIFLLNAASLLPGGGLAGLTGTYGVPNFVKDLNGIAGRYEYYLSRMVMGTGVIAFVLGAAWVLRGIARPRDARRHALAVICALGVAAVLFSLVQAGTDERYVMYGAIPIALAFAAEINSLARGDRASVRWSRVGAIGVMLGAAGAIALLAVVSWPPMQGTYAFFAYPAGTFYVRVVLGRVSELSPLHVSPAYVVYAGIVAAAIAWIAIRRLRRLHRLGAILVAALAVGICATETAYSLQKFTASPAAVADGANAAQRSWLERILPPNEHVAAVGIGLGTTTDYVPIWRTEEFWNTAIRSGVAFHPWSVPTIPFDNLGLTMAVHRPSGRLSISTPTRARVGHILSVPRYLLLPRQASNPVGFAAKLVADAPMLPLELVRLRAPARLEWSLAGTSPEGFMAPGKPATATVYSGALTKPRRCVGFALTGPPGFKGRWPYRVLSGGRVAARGGLAEQQTAQIEVPLRPRAVRGGLLAAVTVKVRGGVPYPNGETVSAKITSVAVSRCRA